MSPQHNEPTVVEPRTANNHTLPAAQASAPRRRRWLWVLLVAGVVGAIAIAAKAKRPDPREALPPDTTSPNITAVPVTVEPITVRAVQRKIEAIGTLFGFEEVTLNAKVEGRVKVVRRDLGDRVRAGEVLIEIESTEYELAVAQEERALQVELAKLGLQALPEATFDPTKVPSVIQARVRMETAHAKMKRTLGTTTALSAEDRDTAAGEYHAAEAEHANQTLLAHAGLATARLKQASLASAKLKLAETKISVPSPTRAIPGTADGVTYALAARFVSEGTMVRPGTEVCKLVIDRTLKLRPAVPERFGLEVAVGQTVEVQTAVAPVTGTVARISPWVDPTTRAFEIEVHVPNPNGALKTGGFAKANILVRVDQNAVTVPLTALHSFAGTTRVYLLDGGKVKDVPVTLGVQTAEWIEILSPTLPKGSQVVTSGHSVLADGTAVSVRTNGGK